MPVVHPKGLLVVDCQASCYSSSLSPVWRSDVMSTGSVRSGSGGMVSDDFHAGLHLITRDRPHPILGNLNTRGPTTRNELVHFWLPLSKIVLPQFLVFMSSQATITINQSQTNFKILSFFELFMF